MIYELAIDDIPADELAVEELAVDEFLLSYVGVNPIFKVRMHFPCKLDGNELAVD